MKVPSFFNFLRRSEQKGSVMGPYGGYPRTPTITSKYLKQIHDSDENARLAISHISEAVVGIGHSIVVKNLTGTDIKAKEIQRALVRFEDDVDADDLYSHICKEVTGYGYSFTEKVSPDILVNLVRLPIEDSWYIDRVDKGGALKTIENKFTGDKFFPNELIYWRQNQSGTRDPFGRGILTAFAETRNYTLEYQDGSDKTFTVPNLYELMAMFLDDTRLVAHHLIPKSVWMIKNAPQDYADQKAKETGKMSAGERVFSTYEMSIISELINPRLGLEKIGAFFDGQIIRATEAPILGLYTGGRDYAETASKEIVKQFQRKIKKLRSYYKRNIEREIYKLFLQGRYAESTLDQYEVELQWNPEEVPIQQLQDYVNIRATGDLSREEFRFILFKKFDVPLPEFVKGEAPAEMPKPALSEPQQTLPLQKSQVPQEETQFVINKLGDGKFEIIKRVSALGEKHIIEPKGTLEEKKEDE